MAYDLEEQEKLDELKDWWRRWGTLVTALVVAAALAVVGYRVWNYYQGDQAVKAARLYEQLDRAIAGKQVTLVREITGTLLDQYSGTAYAEMAALSAARANVDGGDLKSAQAQLQWAAEHARDAEYRSIARLRLAGVLLDSGQGDAALKALDGNVPESFEAAFADRRGDILASQNKLDAARQQYQTALLRLGVLGPDVRAAYTNVIQLKLDALGSVVPIAANLATTPAGVAPAVNPTPTPTPAPTPAVTPAPAPAAAVTPAPAPAAAPAPLGMAPGASPTEKK